MTSLTAIVWPAERLGGRGVRLLSWVDWWNHRRLHGACNDTPPAEFETL